MAAKLQCEICGGKLIGKPGGIFECDSCGMEYDTAWAKAKIQEIQGTVKVEGTVEVKGKVQVDGPVKVQGMANVQSLLERTYLLMEEQDNLEWDDEQEANEKYDALQEEIDALIKEILKIKPKCAEAYLCKCGWRPDCSEQFEEAWFEGEYKDNKDVKQAMRFATGDLKVWLDSLKKRTADAEEKDKAERAAAVGPLRLARERIAPAQKLLAMEYDPVCLYGVRKDGKVLAAGNGTFNSAVANWTDVTALAMGRNHLVALRRDGTVLAAGENKNGQCNVSDWTDVVSIAAGKYHTVGLRRDGTVLATTIIPREVGYDFDQSNVSSWQNIASVHTFGCTTVGVRADGTICLEGEQYYDGKWRNWTDIVSVLPCEGALFGLRTDGTVIACIDKNHITKLYQKRGEEIIQDSIDCWESCCEGVVKWRNIVALDYEGDECYGLCADGTINGTIITVAIDHEIATWHDVVALEPLGLFRFVALRVDGTICRTKDPPLSSNPDKKDPLESVTDWKLFDSIDTLEQERTEAFERAEQERKEAEERAEQKWREEAERAEQKRREAAERAERERQERISALTKEQTALNTELANLKGLFTGKRRKEIEARLAQIDAELKKLNG